jgi:hypothetical protein
LLHLAEQNLFNKKCLYYLLKNEESSLDMDRIIPAFLRRKSAQGKAQFFDEDKDPL